jgi:hypothetical protein
VAKEKWQLLENNDLLLNEHLFSLHNIAVIEHTIKALQRQLLAEKATFSCEFAQSLGSDSSKLASAFAVVLWSLA